ncbi:MAG: serine/threonine-protein kinase [Pseudomonadota bacterium]
MGEKIASAFDIFDQVATLPPEDQYAALERMTLSDDMNRIVRRMLLAHQRETGFLGFTSEQPFSLKQGDQLERWQVEEPIGRGGMGEVYRVKRADGSFEQVAALKLVTLGGAYFQLDRFTEERNLIASFEHPGIARVIDGGQASDGRPFFVMELVDGRPIDEACAGLTIDEKLDRFKSVCRSVSYAHAQLVLHRDLKSDNVLMDEDGRARVIDFGVATTVAESSDLKAPMSRVYAAPEQLAGDTPRVETDIWGLGTILFETLTETAFADQNSRQNALGQLPSALRAIIEKALSEDPDDRYSTASDLERDIANYQTDFPVSALPETNLNNLKLFAKRNTLGVVLSGLLVTVLTAGLVGTTVQTRRALSEEAKAVEALEYSEYQSQIAVAARNTFRDVAAEAYKDENAEKTFREILDIEREQALDLYETDPDRAISSLYGLGRMYELRGSIGDIIKTYKPVAESAATPDSIFSVLILEVYATMLVFSQDTDEALRVYDQALALMEERPHLFAINQAKIELHKAEISGDPDQMVPAIDRLISLAEDIPLVDDASRQTYVGLMDNAGYRLIILNENERALDIFEHLLEVNEEIVGPREIPSATFMNNIVGLNTRIGDFEAAQTMNTQLIALVNEESGPSVSLALANRMQGRLFVASGDYASAQEYFGEAVDLFVEYDLPNSNVEMATRMEMAKFEARTGDIATSIENFQQLRLDYDSVFAGSKYLLGLYHKNIGETYSSGDYHSKARDNLEIAIKYLEEDGSRPDILQEARQVLNDLPRSSAQ